MTSRETLEEKIGLPLRQADLKLVVAESCTGGLLAHRITNIPGSSDFFLGGVTSYAYEAKERLLDVSHDTLTKYGAVSRETAAEMAAGARAIFTADYPLEQIISLSITGIAGPGGGMPNKPVGLTWIGLSAPRGDFAWQYIFHGSRVQNKQWAASAALRRLLRYLEPAR